MSMKDMAGFESLNVIPMIDVMLVLLVIVLTTASFIATGRIPVDLPEASSAPRTEDDKPVVVEIDAGGAIHHDGEALALEALEGRLAGVKRETPVLLRADKAVRFQVAVDVLDLLKAMHFTKLAIQTETRQGGAR
ncbi:MAG: biopolymer transporter ExbD [Azoarcus sp.]|jgi:biopolymer transport protein ExbD|nr:biopolymer transporter ExbD [Azoarcus sp.]